MAGLTDISVSNYTKVEYKSGSTSKAILNVESFSGLGGETNIIDVMQFNAKYARRLIGSSSASPIEIVCTYNPSDVSFVDLLALQKNETKTEFKITQYANAEQKVGSTITVNAFVSSIAYGNEFDAQRTVTWTLAVDGEIGAPVALA
ncbi:hypothetical protein [Aeromonas popoffii]|uniref:hypothetical protein n=1 Tax=Aeromonas popoffii TaxID=70856 RepID=UPI0030D4E27F